MTQYLEAQEQQILFQKVEIMPCYCAFSAFQKAVSGESCQRQRWCDAKYLNSIKSTRCFKIWKWKNLKEIYTYPYLFFLRNIFKIFLVFTTYAPKHLSSGLLCHICQWALFSCFPFIASIWARQECITLERTMKMKMVLSFFLPLYPACCICCG